MLLLKLMLFGDMYDAEEEDFDEVKLIRTATIPEFTRVIRLFETEMLLIA